VRDGLLKMLGLCVLAGVLVAGMAFPLVGGIGVVSNRASDTVDSLSADLVTTDPPLLTTITDRDGSPIAYLFDQYRVLTAPDKIANTMKAAIVSVEDQRFYDHQGVDWRGTLRALVTNQVKGQVSQGGSSLTQQYVKNYLVHVVARNNKVDQEKAQEQTPARKLREIRIALQLERKLSKDQILAGYLNTVPFGNGAYGVAAAASTYFGTTPNKLTIAQAALLAGIVNSPTVLNPERNPDAVLLRRNLVIDRMLDQKRITQGAADAAKSEPLGVIPSNTPPNGCVSTKAEYGFFCKYVVDYLGKLGLSRDSLDGAGYTIRTTLDPKASQAAKKAAEGQVPKATVGIANAVAIVQPGKDRHRVVALAANRDYGLDASRGQTTYPLPSGVENKFGAGSIYKIFTAAAALEKGMGINNIVDSPAGYASRVFKGGGPECPSFDPWTRWYCLGNAGPFYAPQMTLQHALATSPNTTFVILEEKLGMAAPVDMATRLGMRETMQSNTVGNPPNPQASSQDLRVSQSDWWKADHAAFTLSPAATSTLELANVGATLVSGGMWCPPSPIEQVLDRNGKPVNINESPCEQAVPENLANTLAVGLSKDTVESGTAAAAAKAFNWTRPTMGKTGTTQEHKSAGFLGATPQYAGAVQTFNDGSSPRPICDLDPNPPKQCADGNVYGGKVPARTWFEAMTPIHEGLETKELPHPDPRYVNGGDEIRVPSVVGKRVREAKEILTQAGYRVSTRYTDSDRPKDTVIGQIPQGAVLPGTTITLQLSNGRSPQPESQESSAPETPSRPTTAPNPAGGDQGGG
jgi:membrane peptidoglycan carboxypeptidase